MSNDAHARPPKYVTEPLYDVDIPTPSHAERARSMVSLIATGTLCTVGHEPAGYPYGSFVTVAFDGGHPVFLISALAEHTKNLRRDARASLLLTEAGDGDPLARGRVTLIGTCAEVAGDGGSARHRFLEKHPNAAYYVDFKDFSFWKLQVEAIRYIGGYGRMSWVTRDDWLTAECDPLVSQQAGILEHMNEDHSDAMIAYCRAFTRATDTTAATMTGIDRYGFEMSAITGQGPRPIRLAFPEPIATPDDARVALVALVRDARAKLAAAE